jgi:hypothetical protein
MNWNIVLTSAVIATTLSSIAGFFFWSYQKKHEFKYDYRKYILDKRKTAYDLIEDLFIYDTSYHTLRGNEQYYYFFDSLENVLVFHEKLNKAIVKSFWLSNGLSESLSQLYNFISRTPFMKENELQRFGIENHDEVFRIFNRIKSQYFQDLTTLDNIKAHTNSKTVDDMK